MYTCISNGYISIHVLRYLDSLGLDSLQTYDVNKLKDGAWPWQSHRGLPGTRAVRYVFLCLRYEHLIYNGIGLLHTYASAGNRN